MNKLKRKLRELEVEKIKKREYLSNWIFDNNVEVENPYERSPLADRIRTELRNLRNLNFQTSSLREMLKTTTASKEKRK